MKFGLNTTNNNNRFILFRDDVQSVLRSLSPQYLWASQYEMQIDLIRYEPLTLSLRRILNSLSNSFLEFCSYEGFSLVISERMKHKASHRWWVNGGWHETLNLLRVSKCEMLHFVTSYMKQNKNRKQTLESAQNGLKIIINTQNIMQ